MARLLVSNLSKYFGDEMLFSEVSFEVGDSDRVGLVGVNGSGKTTLFKILTDEYASDSGEIAWGKNTAVGYMEQHVCKDLEITAYDEVLTVFAELAEEEQQLEALRIRMQHASGEALARLIEEQTALREAFERRGGLTYRSRARSALLGLGFTEEQMILRVGVLSGGQKAKLQLAKMLLCGANLLLLDEPTNHLDIPSVEWLEDFLKAYTGAFLVISHDRYFLDKITGRTFEMENHRLTCYNGNYTRYLALKKEAQIAAERHYSNVRKEIGRIEGMIEQQKQWNQERNYRIIDNKQKMIDRLSADLVKPENAPETFHFSFGTKRTSGNEVLQLKDISLSFGEKSLFHGVDLQLRRKERVFLLGPNGCGKTSLLRLILGQYAPTGGSIRFGTGVDIGYYDQIQQGLSSDKAVIDELWDDWPTMTQTEIRNALAIFLFKGEDVFKPVSALSGGERARLLLLKLMMSQNNFLLLDEPTNHLDITSREALENALQDYDGTLFIVSHDRYLINKMADRIYVLAEDGVTAYDGNYDDYIARKKRLEEAAAPTLQEKAEAKPNAYKLQKQQEAEARKKRTHLQKLEEQIAASEAQIAETEALFADPAISSDYEKMLELNAQLETQKSELDAFYAEWMSLTEE